MNQVFLLIGINLSDTVPDETHPHGYGKEAFFWSFLAAIFIFVAGAAFSFYEGIRTAVQNDVHERSATELALAFGVLLIIPIGGADMPTVISLLNSYAGLASSAQGSGYKASVVPPVMNELQPGD